MSSEPQKTESVQEAKKHLIFRVGTQIFAVPLLSVREVSSKHECRPVPGAPSHYVGVTNLRGTVITVLSLRSKLALDPGERVGDEVMLVVDLEQTTLGVIVDEVQSVRAIAADAVDSRPHIASRIKGQHVVGIAKLDGDLVAVIDLQALLADDVMEAAA